MDTTILKAIADETRMKILKLLLKHNYCVGALARQLEITESAVSQHLKILRDANLLIGEKKGYYMHYDVDREQLKALASELETLASIQREGCESKEEDCIQNTGCKESQKECSEDIHDICHGSSDKEHKHCKCHD